MRQLCKSISVALIVTATGLAAPASAQQTQKPNILVIMADDIGYWNISAYNRGMMGYHTPNIDRNFRSRLAMVPLTVSRGAITATPSLWVGCQRRKFGKG